MLMREASVTIRTVSPALTCAQRLTTVPAPFAIITFLINRLAPLHKNKASDFYYKSPAAARQFPSGKSTFFSMRAGDES